MSAAAATADPMQVARAHNMDYLRKTRRKYSIANNINSSSSTQNFQTGAPLVFEIPSTNNGYLEYLEIDCKLTADYTPAGSGPTVAFNAGGAEQVINNVVIELGRQQVKMYPYWLKRIQNMLRRYLGAEYAAVAGGGYSNPDIAGTLQTDTPTINSGNNTWHLVIPIPLKIIHALEPAGMLPIFGTSSAVRITVNCAQAIVGTDPLDNAIASNGTVAVTGTVQVNFAYRDGTRFDTTAKDVMVPQLLTGLPTVQMDIDVPTTELRAGAYVPGRLTKLEQFLFVNDIIIDGNQSNKFMLPSNLLGLGISSDANASDWLWQVGQGTRLGADGMAMWQRDLRETWGQDLDDGVIPWFVASSMGEQFVSAQTGSQIFDTANAWPGAHFQYWLNSINGLGVQGMARVEHLIVFLNNLGLQIVGS